MRGGGTEQGVGCPDNSMAKLISNYKYELIEDHHSFGSGRYSLVVILPDDISAVFPYLNSVLDDTRYYPEDKILIGMSNKQGYAFRPHEIRIAVLVDAASASCIAGEAVELVNRVWEDRDHIIPSVRERKLPAAFDIYRLLPKSNCKKCGSTCLAFAAKLRSSQARLEQCPLLSQPEHADSRERIVALFALD